MFQYVCAPLFPCVSFGGITALMLVLQIAACGAGSTGSRTESPQTQRPGAETTTSPTGQTGRDRSSGEVPIYTYEVVNHWPHDPQAYTQGLVFHDGALFESTGLYGSSSLRKVDLQSGAVLKRVDVPGKYFAEGITIFRGKVFQLTWQSQKGFIYDLNDFKLLGEFSYEGEGWGLTHDDQFLIMSDGTSRIRFLDPSSFRVVRTIRVSDNNIPVTQLNELEYIKGEIYANVWHMDRIARLDPGSGNVLGWIDLMGLRPLESRHDVETVLNGIAYDETNDRLFVTGKRWPKIFEIRLKRSRPS